ncbi:MAG: hypothetical protein KGI70_00260 [Patescibacteria group bacterium]|nr:hypothetical protein [Patescibacteria group bacterium]
MFGPGDTFRSVVTALVGLIDMIIPVLTAAAIVFFFYGLAVKYMKAPTNKENWNMVLWSLIALFILFSIWGILRVLQNTFLGGVGSGVNWGGPVHTFSTPSGNANSGLCLFGNCY